MRRTTRSRARAAAQSATTPAPEALPARDPAAAGQAAAPAVRELPTELFLRVLELLPPNEQALSGRLACKDAARRLSTPRHRTVRCGQPLPEHAADEGWQRQLSHQLPFRHKLQLLSTSAVSGCEANVRLAWAVLQPCLFPDMVSEPGGTSQYPYGANPDVDDPGTAAAKAGHTHMISWLVAHGCPLRRIRTLHAAALHSGLEVLQAVWGLLPEPDGVALAHVHSQVANLAGSAARSRTPDAWAKVCWLLDRYRATLSTGYLTNVLVSAAEAGRFDLVRHLYDMQHGQDLNNFQGRDILQSALQHADLAAADWLVDEAGVVLPTGWVDTQAYWLWQAAARGGRADALRWLVDRGVPPHQSALAPALKTGRLDCLRILLEECGLQEEPWVPYDAVRSGNMDTVAWLWQRRRLVPSPRLYTAAGTCGSVAMVEWLMQQVGCPVDQDTALSVLCKWPCSRPTSSSTSGGGSGDSSDGGRDDGSAGAAGGGAMGLLRALQLLAEGGCPLGRLDHIAMVQVAKHGDMDLAQWVVQQAGAGRWPQHAMQCIVEHWPEGGAPGSRLCDAVRMVLEAGSSPGSCREVRQAARRADLEVVRLLHGQGQLRLEPEVWVAAAEGGCEAVLEWLAAEGCRVGTYADQDPYLAAGLRGDRGGLCTLRRLGVPWGHRGVLRAAVDTRIAPPVVRWMVEAGAPWDAAAVAEAAEAARGLGHEGTAVWLEQQGAARGG